jgi:hypothetical protein
MVFTTRCVSGSSQGRNGKRWLLPAALAGALVVGAGRRRHHQRHGGPAAAAGLRAGDVITKISGPPAASPVQLQELTLSKQAATPSISRSGAAARPPALPSPWAPSRSPLSGTRAHPGPRTPGSAISLVGGPERAQRHFEAVQTPADDLGLLRAGAPGGALSVHRRADRMQGGEHVSDPGLLIRI